MKNKIILLSFIVIILFLARGTSKLYGQPSVNRDTVLIAAFEIIKETTYCALVTIDSTGQPQVRTIATRAGIGWSGLCVNVCPFRKNNN